MTQWATCRLQGKGWPYKQNPSFGSLEAWVTAEHPGEMSGMQQQLFEQGIASWERSLCRARESQSPGLGGKIENKKKLAKEKGVPLERVWLHPI